MLKFISCIFTVFFLVSVAYAEEVKVSGYLNAGHTHVNGNVVITAEKTVFMGSHVNGSITIKSSSKAPEIALQCKTVINGDITFVGQSGMVRKSIDSIINGKVVNGTIVPSTSNVKCK